MINVTVKYNTKVWELHIDAMVTYPALIMHHVILKFLVKVVMVT